MTRKGEKVDGVEAESTTEKNPFKQKFSDRYHKIRSYPYKKIIDLNESYESSGLRRYGAGAVEAGAAVGLTYWAARDFFGDHGKETTTRKVLRYVSGLAKLVGATMLSYESYKSFRESEKLVEKLSV
ncbi:hypothetical protein A3K63_00740 [Candidatus Micrarchaeota archaeon RBG_16_49_10]|nr:MAG: hypothetical protein A3K63_00740 [Candidatus Micrarchaeota archaeon RBG_16_49_10]